MALTEVREQLVDSLPYMPGLMLLSSQRISTGLSTLLCHYVPSHAYACLSPSSLQMWQTDYGGGCATSRLCQGPTFMIHFLYDLRPEA